VADGLDGCFFQRAEGPAAAGQFTAVGVSGLRGLRNLWSPRHPARQPVKCLSLRIPFEVAIQC
jgi:hypothetical protein